ncbi:MAG TPA: c-type cytochrome [Terriglobales bacterium]|nr:c-type cytochrome [Terriglobales bacterium]
MKRSFAVLVIASALAFGALAQDSSVKYKSAKVVPATDGKQMFATYCASCHGTDGKGKGAAASSLKKPAADLTTLSKRHGGKFPAELVNKTLKTPTSTSHLNKKDMPSWGSVFSGMGDEAQANLRVHNLTEYLRSLQVSDSSSK